MGGDRHDQTTNRRFRSWQDVEDGKYGVTHLSIRCLSFNGDSFGVEYVVGDNGTACGERVEVEKVDRRQDEEFEGSEEE